MDNWNQNKIIEEFHTNFPFLDLDKQLQNSSIKFITSVQGNYSGEVKAGVLRYEDPLNKTDGTSSYDYLGNFTTLHDSSSTQIMRHGWGKMTWKNGTLYGSELQFVYSDQDEYIGQWFNNSQNGKNRN